MTNPIELFRLLDNPDMNRTEYYRLLSKKRNVDNLAGEINYTLPSEDYDITSFNPDSKGDLEGIAMFDHLRESIIFYSVFVWADLSPAIKDLVVRPIVRCYTWRDYVIDGGKATAGLTSKVLFKCLLSKYNLLLADGVNIRTMPTVWKKFLSIALDYEIYKIYTFGVASGEWVHVQSRGQLRETFKWLWGSDVIQPHKHVLIVKDL